MTEEQKRKAKEIQKATKDMILALQILREDTRFAEHLLNQHKTSHEQTCRRTLIRCACAFVEGTLSLMKVTAIPAANFFDISLSGKETEFVTGREIKTGKPIPFLPFRENLKETLKVFMKAHDVSVEIKHDESGFKDLHEMFKLRNRLMHPKILSDVGVSDEALKGSIRGFNWFDAEGVKIMAECKKKQVSVLTSI
jgi:hypothetical protein